MRFLLGTARCIVRAGYPVCVPRMGVKIRVFQETGTPSTVRSFHFGECRRHLSFRGIAGRASGLPQCKRLPQLKSPSFAPARVGGRGQAHLLLLRQPRPCWTGVVREFTRVYERSRENLGWRSGCRGWWGLAGLRLRCRSVGSGSESQSGR